METLLSEINLNVGVVGSVILNKDNPEVMGNLPSFFRPEKLCSFADHVRRFAILGEEDGGFHGMEFCYEQTVVVARGITKTHLLLTFCLPEVDVQQIHLQHHVLLSELQDMIEKMAITTVPVEPLPTPIPEQKTAKKRTLMYRGVAYEE